SLFCSGSLRVLHSFPTRRSSDLALAVHDAVLAIDVFRIVLIFVVRFPPGECDHFPALIVDREDDTVAHHVIYTAALGLIDQSQRSEEHTSELQSRENLVCRLLLE